MFISDVDTYIYFFTLSKIVSVLTGVWQ